MVQIEQDLQALLDDLVTPEAVHVRDETDATSIVLVTGVIETLTHRESVSVELADHHRIGGVGEDQPISIGDPLGGIPVPRSNSSVMHLPTLGSNPAFQQKITMMQTFPNKKRPPPHWRRPLEEPKSLAQLTRRRLQCAALLWPRCRDSGQVLAHASSVNGERSSDPYLRRPICEDLPGVFTCSPWGRRAPDNLSELANPAGPFGPVKHRQVARGNRRE